MKTQVALAALLLAGVAQLVMAAPVQDDTAVWSEWKATHNKQYATPEEEARRLAVFLDNKKRIDEHNAKFSRKEVSYSMSLNPFADLTNDEFRLRNGHGAAPIPMEEAAARDPEWAQWKATHSKQYESAVEEGRRYAVFLDNKKFVDEHNAKFDRKEVSYSVGLNAFSDLTSEEFKSRHTGLLRPKRAVQNLDAAAMKQWGDWKAEHNKQYETPEEEARRYAVFLDNKKFVDEHNAKFDRKEVSYSVGLNAFSDLTSEEFKNRHTGLVRPKRAVQNLDAAAMKQWGDWKAEHNKQYETPEEEARRYAVFLDNKKFVDEHNAKFDRKEVSYSVGLNAFSDLTSEEFKNRHTGLVRPKRAVQNLDAAAMKQWGDWKAEHNKQYETPEEEARRYAVFLDNKKRIDEHNAKFDKKEVSYSMGLNAFSDLTSDELKKRFGHGVLPRKN